MEVTYPYWCQLILTQLDTKEKCTYIELAKCVGINYDKLDKSHHERSKLKRFDHVINAMCWALLTLASLADDGEPEFRKVDDLEKKDIRLSPDGGMASAIWCFLMESPDTYYSLEEVTLAVCKSMNRKYRKGLRNTVKCVLQTLMIANIVDININFRWKVTTK